MFLMILWLCACSKDEIANEKRVEAESWSVNPSGQYAINVVFFKPIDYTPSEEILNNVGNLMLYIQKWYGKQMELNGYDEKTFGLVVNQNRKVRVLIVEGEHPSSYYKDLEEQDSYSTLSIIKSQVEDYFNNNPDLKESSHTMVFAPEETLLRFVGSGRYAFARSSTFTLASTGKYIDDLELMKADGLGGIMHELGHGLNLPHNAHKKSDLPKIALMSFGNHTYENGNEENVFLTPSTGAILNVNEAFNKKDNGIDYYSGADIKLLSYTVQKNPSDALIHAEGVISSNKKITHVYIGHDGTPFGGNNNYDKVTFTTAAQNMGGGKYNFSLNMPYAELFNNYKDENKSDMLLTLNAISENGTRKQIDNYNYSLDLSTQIPNDDVNRTFEIFEFRDRSSWTITSNTVSPNPDRVVEKILDGDLNSYWRSKYPYSLRTDGPHQLDINMNEEKTFSGIYMNSNMNNGNYWRPKEVSVQVSTNGSNYSEIKTFMLETEDIEQKFLFDAEVTAQYIRILVKDVYHSKEDDESLLFNEIDILTQ